MGNNSIQVREQTNNTYKIYGIYHDNDTHTFSVIQEFSMDVRHKEAQGPFHWRSFHHNSMLSSSYLNHDNVIATN